MRSEPSADRPNHFADAADRYRALHADLAALLAGERDWLVNLATTAALLNQALPDLNWVGYYLWRGGELVVGPYQGKPACTRIARGRGVCGAAAARRASVVVVDTHEFPGHIACDPASASELVVPLALPDRQLGVLDLDSPRGSRFAEEDRLGLEEIGRHLVAATDWPAELGDRF